MKHLIDSYTIRPLCLGFIIWQVFMLVFSGCTSKEAVTNAEEQALSPALFPDYKEVTIPYNIAPLNFRIEGDVEKCYAQVKGSNSAIWELYGKNEIRFSPKRWKQLMEANKGQSLSVSIATKEQGRWLQWQPFSIYVSDQPIDSHIVYRLIEPGYEKWHIVGIYQRDLTSFKETPIIRNDMTDYNCINCHSFCMGNPNQMMFHMRATNGATYIIQDRQISKLNTKTKETISNLTYPYWHPSGRYITTSVNDIKQFFHSVKEKKMEVFDLESDVVIYDVKEKAILADASLITREAFETFPSFSPDGKWLYFCTTPAQKMPDHYNNVRYHLCRIAFDAEQGRLSLPIDTLVRADSLSYTFPRISPDGRFLLYTETAYGQFPIWHTDAELRMLNLEDRTEVDMSALNSPDTESYHSWGSNSRWVVFSSRRDNGLYTLPYLCHIGPDGKPSKPFLLPQKDPNKYDYLLYSYNLPELTTEAVEVSPYHIQHVAQGQPAEPIRYKNKD